MPLDLTTLQPYRPIAIGCVAPNGRLVMPAAHWFFLCPARALLVVVGVN
jgi:hypothetical protein